MAAIQRIFISFALSTAVFYTCNQSSHIDILCLGALKNKKKWFSHNTKGKKSNTTDPFLCGFIGKKLLVDMGALT